MSSSDKISSCDEQSSKKSENVLSTLTQLDSPFEDPIEYEYRSNLGKSRYFLLFIALICSIWSTGLIFGWAPLYGILLRAGTYSHVCSNSSSIVDSMVSFPPNGSDIGHDVSYKTCSEQQKKLNLIYTAGSSCTQASLFISGILLDWQGPKFTVTFSALIVALGATLFGISAANFFDLYIVGYALMGFGGAGVNLATYTVSNLFPRRKSWVVSALVGTWTLSSLWFLIFRPAFNAGIELAKLFYAQALLLIITALIFFITFPSRSLKEGEIYSFKKWFPWNNLFNKQKNGYMYHKDLNDNQHSNMNKNELQLEVIDDKFDRKTKNVDDLISDEHHEESSQKSNRKDMKTKDMSGGEVNDDQTSQKNKHGIEIVEETNESSLSISMIKGVLNDALTIDFALLTIWFAIFAFFFEFYIGTIADALEFRTTQSVYPFGPPGTIPSNPERVDKYVLTFNILYALGFTFVPLYAWSTDTIGFVGSFFFATLFSVAYPLISIIPWLPAQFIAYTVYSAAIQFTYSCQFGFVSSRFGYKHFGVLIGMIGIVTACLIPLQSVFLRIVIYKFGGNFFWMYLIQGLSSLPLFGVVIWNWLSNRKKLQSPEILELNIDESK